MLSNLEAQVCMLPGGFQSYAPAFETDGCEPGFIQQGCKAPRRITHVISAGLTDRIRIDPYQPLKVGAIVDIGSTAGTTIDDMEVDGQSLFPRVEDEAGDFVARLGLISTLDPELYRSGLNPLPPQPAIDKTDPMFLEVTGAAADVIDLYVYFVNPPPAGRAVA